MPDEVITQETLAKLLKGVSDRVGNHPKKPDYIKAAYGEFFNPAVKMTKGDDKHERHNQPR